MSVKTTVVFEKLLESKNRLSVFQGSSRASKTYNILIYWVYRLLQEEGKILNLSKNLLMVTLEAVSMQQIQTL